MSRRSREAEESFTLFPFLAVLLCVMGTLALIFALVSQKGSENAPTDEETLAAGQNENERENDALVFDPEIAATNGTVSGRVVDEDDAEDDAYAAALIKTNAATLDEIVGEMESLDWFLDELQGVRERTKIALDEERARLAGIESELERLRSESEVARRKYEALCAEKVSREGEDAVALQERIDALDVELERLSEEARRLREQNADAKRSYAIVPYQGKKGTFRRPIYVECNSEGVFIQPEGIRFDERDFLVARYPGNPFDSALRATSQHFLSVGGGRTTEGETIEPYPLIIVRPSGAEYFYATVAALASWGDLYGYEFIDEDQEIAYPEPDPTLKENVSRQADFARARLSAQLEAALSARQATIAQYNASPARAYESASQDPSELNARFGNNVRVGAAKVAATPSAVSDGTNASNARMGGNLAASSNGTELYGGGPYGGAASVPDGLNGGGGGVLSQATAANPSYTGAYAKYIAAAPSNGGGEAAPTGSDASNGTLEGASDAPNGSVASARTSSDGVAADTNFVPNAALALDASAPSGAGAPSYLASLQGSAQDTSATSDAASVDPTHTLGNTTYAQGARGDSSSGKLASKDTNYIAPAEKSETTGSTMPKEAISLTKERPTETGNERGILVRCAADGFVFPKQPGARAATSVERSGKSREEVERELLDSIAYYIRSWGVAGRNAYWAPFLKVEVEPGGEDRFNELSDFCDRQGLAIIRIRTNDLAK